MASGSGELNPLIPHPLEIAILLTGVGLIPFLVMVVWGLVLLARERITLWPTFAVCVALGFFIPCIGSLVALVVLYVRRHERSGPDPAP